MITTNDNVRFGNFLFEFEGLLSSWSELNYLPDVYGDDPSLFFCYW